MDKTKIDWCDSTWNPITGCLHNCEYCYARGIVRRFGMPQHDNNNHVYTGEIKSYDDAVHTGPFPWGFAPTFHTYRLNDYRNKKGRIIFVGSMCDLFGEWVPDSWIDEVFKACEAAPQHKYLFLTKNHRRYKRDPLWRYNSSIFKPDWWFGATITGTESYDDMWDVLIGLSYCRNAFLSIEPLLNRVSFPEKAVMPKWVIVGAESGRRKDKVIPAREWIENIVNQCQSSGVPVFMKESLRGIMGADFIQEWPDGLRR